MSKQNALLLLAAGVVGLVMFLEYRKRQAVKLAASASAASTAVLF